MAKNYSHSFPSIKVPLFTKRTEVASHNYQERLSFTKWLGVGTFFILIGLGFFSYPQRNLDQEEEFNHSKQGYWVELVKWFNLPKWPSLGCPTGYDLLPLYRDMEQPGVLVGIFYYTLSSTRVFPPWDTSYNPRCILMLLIIPWTKRITTWMKQPNDKSTKLNHILEFYNKNFKANVIKTMQWLKTHFI